MKFAQLGLIYIFFTSEHSCLQLQRLPTNPCSSHTCPVDQECQLIRLPCLFYCDMVPTCNDRKPVNEIGRETEPSTLQFQVQTSRTGFNKRLGLLSDEAPPDFIKQLVKGLSTEQVIQRPFLTSIVHKPSKSSSLMRSRKYLKKEPLVFLSRDLSEQKRNNFYNPHPLERTVKSEEQILIDEILTDKPMILIKGPGLQQYIKPEKMNINFPIQSNSIDSNAPKLGVMSIYDLRPWDRKEDLEIHETHMKKIKKHLTYREAMEILESSTKHNELLLDKLEKRNQPKFSLIELGKQLLSIPQLKEIFRFSRHSEAQTNSELIPQYHLYENTDLKDQVDMEHLSWKEFQKQIVELSKDAFTIINSKKLLDKTESY